MRLSTLTLMSILLCPFLGCNQSQEPSVAVVDLDAVAEALGRDDAISAALKAHGSNLNQQVAGVKKSLENQLLAEQTKLGQEPADDGTKQLVNLQRQAELKFNQVTQQARGHLQQFRADLVLKFRAEAQEVARQIAHEKGHSLVMTKNDSVVLVYDEAVDITQAVTERMRDTSTPSRFNTAAQPAGEGERR